MGRERVPKSSKTLSWDKRCTSCATEHPRKGDSALFVCSSFIVTHCNTCIGHSPADLLPPDSGAGRIRHRLHSILSELTLKAASHLRLSSHLLYPPHHPQLYGSSLLLCTRIISEQDSCSSAPNAAQDSGEEFAANVCSHTSRLAGPGFFSMSPACYMIFGGQVQDSLSPETEKNDFSKLLQCN